MSNDMKSIVDRIKKRRIELGYSFQDLANKTNMSKSTLQRYETGGIKNLPLDKLNDLATALKVTPEWLMGWDYDNNSFAKSKGKLRSISRLQEESISPEEDEQIAAYIEFLMSRKDKNGR